MHTETYLNNLPDAGKSVIPTPLQKLESISEFSGASVYCKRDDLTGFAFGGNKTRKLDLLIGDAVFNRKSDTIVCVGANQSNFCRLSSAYGAYYGLETHLVLGGKKPDKPTGNLLVDYLMGAVVHHVDSDDWSEWESSAGILADELTRKGRNVYFMPIGGSTVTGALGYVKCFTELISQCRNSGTEMDYIFHATASAGTQAGLLTGKYLSGWKGEITGIAVAKNKQQLTDEIYALSVKTSEIFGNNISRNDVIVDDNYIGAEYGAYTEGADEAVKLFARKEGIMLDYVYSGKAASAMLDYIKSSKIKKGSNVLFLHTGGNIQLFK